MAARLEAPKSELTVLQDSASGSADGCPKEVLRFGRKVTYDCGEWFVTSSSYSVNLGAVQPPGGKELAIFCVRRGVP